MAQTRIITIYSTRGNNLKEIELPLKATFGDLRPLIAQKYPDVDLNNMNLIESINNMELVSETSILPSGDFTVVMTPVDSKAGLDFKTAKHPELVKFVSTHKNSVNLKAYLEKNTGSKKWNQIKKDVLIQKLIAYTAANRNEKKAAEPKEKKTTTALESKKPEKETTDPNVAKEVIEKTVEKVVDKMFTDDPDIKKKVDKITSSSRLASLKRTADAILKTIPKKRK